MSTNPLKVIDGKRTGKVTVDDLTDLADSLNAEWWVERMGRHYFVGKDERGRHQLSWQARRV